MYTLILYIFAGALAKGDSVALVSVPGFTSKASCDVAGQATAKFVEGSMKNHKFACVKLGA